MRTAAAGAARCRRCRMPERGGAIGGGGHMAGGGGAAVPSPRASLRRAERWERPRSQHEHPQGLQHLGHRLPGGERRRRGSGGCPRGVSVRWGGRRFPVELPIPPPHPSPAHAALSHSSPEPALGVSPSQSPRRTEPCGQVGSGRQPLRRSPPLSPVLSVAAVLGCVLSLGAPLPLPISSLFPPWLPDQVPAERGHQDPGREEHQVRAGGHLPGQRSAGGDEGQGRQPQSHPTPDRQWRPLLRGEAHALEAGWGGIDPAPLVWLQKMSGPFQEVFLVGCARPCRG